MRAVLIVVDMINGSFDGWADETRARLVRDVNALALGLRILGAPVIWVRQEYADDLHDAPLAMRDRGVRGYVRGTPASQLVVGLDVRPTDEILVKKRYSAFFGTDLDARLAGHAPSRLVIAGVNTHACIRTTAIDAYQRDWRVILAADCIASYDVAHHDISLAYMNGRIGTALENAAIFALLKT